MKRTIAVLMIAVFSCTLPYSSWGKSLWKKDSTSFAPDVEVGDLVTIEVSESAEGQTESTREREKSTEIGGQASVGAGGATIVNQIASWIPLFGPTISGSSSYESEREGDAFGSLTTTMTVKVAEVKSNGMVRLRGERKVKIDDEIQEITFEGLARAQDIEGDNTISSNRIAN
ncbi:MAG: flagellar basal body L-ring protein FlgH, partial [bacterium]